MTLLLLTLPRQGDAQLNKLKDKINKAMDKAVDKAIGNEVEKQTGIPTGDASGSSSGKPANKGGAGLTNTEPPDVKAQMEDAQLAHNSNKYSDARYSLQQALMGVEIQLGRQILASLPAEVGGLKADPKQDKVMSTQWGWSNLTIQKEYADGKDKQMTITIGNAGIYSGLAQWYFANAGMVEASGEQQNMKQVRVKGNKGMIQYDDSRGYTLMISLGQTSGIVWECINFATEKEVMDAANTFDIDEIKKMLGEQ